MASFEEELMQDAQEDAAAVAYILSRIPEDLKGKFSEESIYYFLDILSEYYAESGVLDATPDEDGCIDINEEEVAKHLKKCAEKDKIGNFETEDLMHIIDAELDFSESKL